MQSHVVCKSNPSHLWERRWKLIWRRDRTLQILFSPTQKYSNRPNPSPFAKLYKLIPKRKRNARVIPKKARRNYTPSKLVIEVSWYSLEQYIGFVVRQAFNYCCSLHQVWRKLKTKHLYWIWKPKSVKSVKPNSNWKPKKC